MSGFKPEIPGSRGVPRSTGQMDAGKDSWSHLYVPLLTPSEVAWVSQSEIPPR